jgi:hypothetical protein
MSEILILSLVSRIQPCLNIRITSMSIFSSNPIMHAKSLIWTWSNSDWHRARYK